MANVLYLTHRTPYPPDKGDKITTYNFLRHLSAHHRVWLGTFVDSEADLGHVAKLREMCEDALCIPIQPRARRLWSARAVLGSRSLSEVYHDEAALRRWVHEAVPRHGITAALAYCSAMAPYVAGERFARLRRVTHYADVDSQKWRSYAERHGGPLGWVYGREGRTLLRLERAMSAQYDITSFVSDADAELYRQLAPEVAARVRVVPNGVDTDYFDPAAAHARPFADATAAIVFTGAMDYWPNVDAVVWFASEVLHRVRQALPAAEFWIVGSNPSRQVLDLRAIAGVQVTGRVPDVRPYLAHASAVVAPLRIARGTQNKVLEAYSMERRVIMTGAAAGGLLPAPFIAESVADEPQAMAERVIQAMAQTPRFEQAREYVMRLYSWQRSFDLLDEALELA